MSSVSQETYLNNYCSRQIYTVTTSVVVSVLLRFCRSKSSPKKILPKLVQMEKIAWDLGSRYLSAWWFKKASLELSITALRTHPGDEDRPVELGVEYHETHTGTYRENFLNSSFTFPKYAPSTVTPQILYYQKNIWYWWNKNRNGLDEPYSKLAGGHYLPPSESRPDTSRDTGPFL